MNLLTGLALIEDRKLCKDFQLGQFIVDGSEEQIVWKMQRQLLAVFAKHYEGQGKGDFLEELTRLQKKYNVTKETCPS
jgi:hypothetical protein